MLRKQSVVWQCPSVSLGVAGDEILQLQVFSEVVHTFDNVGAGVNASVIQTLHQETGITVFHMSGKRDVESDMIYRNPKVNMGLPQFSEYVRMVTDADAIRRAKEMLLKVTA